MAQFSEAYVTAVAAAVACQVTRPFPDIDSVDLTLARVPTDAALRSSKLDLQMKATSSDCVGDTDVSFPLDVDTYNALRATNYMVPRILVVVVMPRNVEDWLEHDEDHLLLKRCGYWRSLHGAPSTTNTTSITVTLPRSQKFDAAGLHDLFSRLETRGQP